MTFLLAQLAAPLEHLTNLRSHVWSCYSSIIHKRTSMKVAILDEDNDIVLPVLSPEWLDEVERQKRLDMT